VRWRRRVGFLAAAIGGAALVAPGCSSDDGGSKGHPADAGGDVDGGFPLPGPGEQCMDPPAPGLVEVLFQPSRLVLAPDQTREIEVVVLPDICVPTTLRFSTANASIVAAPEQRTIDLLTPRAKLEITGLALGSTTLSAVFPKGDGTDATATLEIDVVPATLPACSGTAAGKLDDGVTLSGSGGLTGASIGFQKGATKPNAGSFLWGVQPLDVTIECAADQVPSGFTPLGPAVKFSPTTQKLLREIPFSVPVNPAAMPSAARMRHVTVSYTGPHAPTPRAVPITNPRIEKSASGYALHFMAPWLGSYQAVVKSDAGSVTRTRKLTHRAVIGISMGGSGAAMVGFRHHDRFDVIAPLGGPVEWTWMLGHIEKNHMSGWLPNDGTTPPSALAPMPTPTLAYEHPSTFNRWWYEYPKSGHGGSFPRGDYVQIFRDLALMFGNPNSYNPAPGAQNLPAGIAPDDKTVVGDHPGRECAVWVDPIKEHPDEAQQKLLDQQCPVERCSYTTTLQNYYDDEFNPTGAFPVITVCDGSPQNSSLSPYANTWSPVGNDKPLELALAVDYNGNGVRDENEPLIRQGYEPFQDTGSDGVPSSAEAGYQPGVNEDPAGDDWHPQYNPTGTENNARWDAGEPFDDFGLDGVANTSTSPYDFGEGNGKFDYSPGYRTFLERDTRSVLEQQPWATQPKQLDDDALARINLWTDGGTRDLFNSGVAAQALAGGWAGRGKIVHYYQEFHNIPGQDPADPGRFAAGRTLWGDVPGGVLLRYGKVDPSPADIESGSGQHVGTADEITRRLQSALYYIGSRWPDAPRTLDEASPIDPNPDLPQCEISGGCDFSFTDSRGRTGPVSVNLPPGYGNIGSKEKRYPVIFLLHGYGQTPEDLKAAIIFLANWMNYAGDSKATRLPKAIMVYVDGRCRPGAVEAECIRGTFYTDSVREHGPKMEAWFLELMGEIDKRYRTLGPSEVEWVE
jgi:hypothetical protein